jgi:hypothetical protein
MPLDQPVNLPTTLTLTGFDAAMGFLKRFTVIVVLSRPFREQLIKEGLHILLQGTLIAFESKHIMARARSTIFSAMSLWQPTASVVTVASFNCNSSRSCGMAVNRITSPSERAGESGTLADGRHGEFAVGTQAARLPVPL